MTIPRFFVLACLTGALSGCAGAADRGNTSEESPPSPPAASRDAIPPSGGALIGGSIESATTPKREIQRCQDLTGTLREQCLRDAREQPIVPER